MSLVDLQFGSKMECCQGINQLSMIEKRDEVVDQGPFVLHFYNKLH